MPRTGWTKTFASACRKLLVQLAQISHDTGRNLALGVYNGTVLLTPWKTDRPPLQDKHTLLKRKKIKTSNSPWATATEVATYKTAAKVLWPGSLPIFSRPNSLARENVIKETKMISTHISSVEVKLNSSC
jgi:hypothetical protein